MAPMDEQVPHQTSCLKNASPAASGSHALIVRVEPCEIDEMRPTPLHVSAINLGLHSTEIQHAESVEIELDDGFPKLVNPVERQIADLADSPRIDELWKGIATC